MKLQTLLDYVERGATATCESIYRQPVAEYTCANQAAAEEQAFFRRRMLCIGLSARLPEPGTFLTDELSGVPVLMTRDAEGNVHYGDKPTSSDQPERLAIASQSTDPVRIQEAAQARVDARTARSEAAAAAAAEGPSAEDLQALCSSL